MSNTRFCITFAGPVGCSKSPVATHLSYSLSLPIFISDVVRNEVKEDRLKYDDNEFQRRRERRLKEILERKLSFICDASVDRRWSELKKYLLEYDYRWFIISIDLSKKFLTKIYKAKKYFEPLELIDHYLGQHEDFLDEFESDVSLHIDDTRFEDRLAISLKATRKWIANLSD